MNQPIQYKTVLNLIDRATRHPTICILCGAHGHLVKDCPWQDEAKLRQYAREDAARP